VKKNVNISWFKYEKQNYLFSVTSILNVYFLWVETSTENATASCLEQCIGWLTKYQPNRETLDVGQLLFFVYAT
jgi:hypothetical protein